VARDRLCPAGTTRGASGSRTRGAAGSVAPGSASPAPGTPAAAGRSSLTCRRIFQGRLSAEVGGLEMVVREQIENRRVTRERGWSKGPRPVHGARLSWTALWQYGKLPNAHM